MLKKDKSKCIEHADGSKYWYFNGKLHRENDLHAVEYADGTKEWYLNGIRQPDRIAKACWIENDESKHEWFESFVEAREYASQKLSMGICAWF